MEVESTTQIPPKREVRARPIDVYRRLPIARLKEESVYEYWNEDNSCQNATKNELEHGMVGSSKKQKRLNIPTPVYHTVQDYENRVQVKSNTAQGPFLRGRPPPRAAPARSWELSGLYCTTNNSQSDVASEYILTHEDATWLATDFVHAVKSKATASANRKAAQQAVERTEELWQASSGAVVAAAVSSKIATRRNGIPLGTAGSNNNIQSGNKAETRAAAAIAAMTEDALEALIEALEVATGPVPNNPVSAARAAEILCNPDPPRLGGLGKTLSIPFQTMKEAATLAAGVSHSYWLAKRRKFNKPLLRRFWPKTAPTDANPHAVFRPREKERYKLRKHRKNDVDAFRKLQHLRKDFDHARELFTALKNREFIKRTSLDLKRGTVRRLLEQGAARVDDSLNGYFADTRTDFDPRLPSEAFNPALPINNETDPTQISSDNNDQKKSIILTTTLANAIMARLEACAPAKAPPPPPPTSYAVEEDQIDSPAYTEQQRKPKRKNRRVPKQEEQPTPKDTKQIKSRPCVPTRGFMESHWWLRGPDAARASRALGGLLEPNLVLHKINDGPPIRSSHLRRRARLGRGGRLVFDVYECHAISVLPQAQQLRQNTQQTQLNDRQNATEKISISDQATSLRSRPPGPPAVTYATSARRALASPLGDALHDTWCQQDDDELARIRRDHCLDHYYDDLSEDLSEDDAGEEDTHYSDDLTDTTKPYDNSTWAVDSLCEPQCRFASVPIRPQKSATISPARLAEIATLSDSEDEVCFFLLHHIHFFYRNSLILKPMLTVPYRTKYLDLNLPLMSDFFASERRRKQNFFSVISWRPHLSETTRRE